MANHVANGIDIEVEESGPRSGVPIILIRGLGTQLIQWPPEILRGLADRQMRIVRFDNRDVGLSEGFDDLGVPDLGGLMRSARGGEAPKVAYSLADMADDTIGVLDALDIRSTHVLGISMGGMIAQRVADRHPDRVRSLISVMSSSGAPGLPGPTPEAAALLVAQPERPGDRESAIQLGIRGRRVFGSPDHQEGEERIRREVEAAHDRANRPGGVLRQLAAVMTDGSRVDLLRGLRLPTLVLHGDADPLVRPEAGADTARHVPGARLEWIAGMGHDLPSGLAPRIVSLVADFVDSVEAARA